MTNWTTIATLSDGGVITAAALNAQLRDNLLHLHERADGHLGFPVAGAPRSDIDTASAFGVANICLFGRVTGSGSVSSIGIGVGTSSGNISVAVYDTGSDSSLPGDRTQTSGAVACPASGYAAVALGASVTADAGDWFAISSDSSTASFYRFLASATDSNTVTPGVGAMQSSAHPAPASASAAPYRISVLMVGV